MDASFSDNLNFNSVEDLPGFNACGDVSLSYIVALLHNNKISEVINLVNMACQEEHCCGMAKVKLFDEEEKDGYSFILDYANSLR